MLRLDIDISPRPSQKRSITIDAPHRWDEFTPAQRAKFLTYIANKEHYDARMSIVRDIVSPAIGLSNFILLGVEQIAALSLHYDHLWKGYTEPVTKTYLNGFTHLYTPRAKAENLTGMEYAIADGYYTDFITSNNPEHLRCLAATLFRPWEHTFQVRRERGDTRTKLTGRDEIIDRAASIMSNVLLHDALFYFTGIKRYIHQLYGRWIFDMNSTENEEEASASNTHNEPDFGWWSVYLTLAELGTFGTIDQVHDTNFHTICTYLVKREIDIKKQNQHNPAPQPQQIL